MSEPLLNALTMCLILLLGYLLKRTGVIDFQSARRFTFVVMYITLPCAILSSAQGLDFDASLLSVMLISFAYNTLLILVAFLSHKPSEMRFFAMFNLPGFNLGNFVLPFMMSIMSSKAFLALALFDLINALFIFGGSYSVALLCNRQVVRDQSVSALTIVKELLKSCPTHAYLIAICCSIFAVTLPPEVLRPIRTLGSANTTLAMLIIGSALVFSVDRQMLKALLRLLSLRYLTALLLSLLVYFYLPYSPEIKTMLIVIAFAPIGSINSVMTMRKLPAHASLSADFVSVTVLISLVLVTLITNLLPTS
ncbi:MAG: hypothetical protein K6F05_04865 [Succinivibrio sp.]|nr:hypothetical protein [Succinivibrio sp.]